MNKPTVYRAGVSHFSALLASRLCSIFLCLEQCIGCVVLIVLAAPRHSMEQELLNDSETLFKKISSAVKPILHEDSNPCENESIYDTIRLIEECQRAIERENLISKNEELEDINTSTLKVTCICYKHLLTLITVLCALVIQFLLLDYYAGKCYQSLRGMENRLVNVLAAKDAYTTYLELCTKLGVVHSADLEGRNEQSSMTADAKRQFKIDKYKRDKAAKTRINVSAATTGL
jgi:hypothetical protein